MPFWFPALRTVVTAAPGTGSTSLTAACAAAPGSIDLLAESTAATPTHLDRKHATLAQLRTHGVFDGEVTDVVTTTRNPYDFYVAEWFRTRTRWAAELPDASSWVHTVPGVVEAIRRAVQLDFPRWVDHELGDPGRPGAPRRINPGHVDEATIVLRMEAMETDLAVLHPRLAAAIGPIAHENRTDRDHDHRTWHTPDTAAAVADAHADDLERFGYRF